MRQLNEKVEAAHRQAAAGLAVAPAASGQRAEVRWAWWQIAAIAVPVLALIAVAAL